MDNVSLIETHGLMFPVVKTICLCSLVNVDYDEILCIFLNAFYPDRNAKYWYQFMISVPHGFNWTYLSLEKDLNNCIRSFSWYLPFSRSVPSSWRLSQSSSIAELNGLFKYRHFLFTRIETWKMLALWLCSEK